MRNIYIKTFGCTLNKYDTLIMKRILKREKFNLTDDVANADIIIVNTCGVKKQTEDRVISYLKRLRKSFRRKIIVGGCLPIINLNRLLKETDVDAIIGVSPCYKVVDVIERLKSATYMIIDISKDSFSPLVPPTYNEVTVVEPIGISFGCLDNCAFCATKFARSKLHSQPIEKIVKYIKLRIKDGIKEFHLTSPDSGAYGFDFKPRKNILNLLRSIESIDGRFTVRLGMINPRWVYKWLEDIIDIFKNATHLFYFLHIPVQSGSPKVLKIMRRNHGVEEYVESVKRIRKEVDRRFTIMTDILVGHPGEEDPDFNETINIINETQPDYINISKFFPRPNTSSKMMKKIPTDTIKERSRVITSLSYRIMLKRNKQWIGWRGWGLVDEKGKDNTMICRNYAYKPIIIKKDVNLGSFIHVKIEDASPIWLSGHFEMEDKVLR